MKALKKNQKRGCACIALLIVLTSCSYQTRKGDELSVSQLNYIKSLGLLEDEEIILFDTQTSLKTSGNFITNKRLATYWIDSRDSSKNSIESAFYSEIDSIKTQDLTRALTYASFLRIAKNDGSSFKVYVDGD